MNQVVVGRLHVLTDYHFQQRFSHSQLAAMAVDGGAEVVQFRDKGVNIRHVLQQAVETVVAVRDRGGLLIVDDRIDVMLASEAHGVHLGQTDVPVAVARKILGDKPIIGATATTIEQAQAAAGDGADYIGFGPVFKTSSKVNPASVKGVEGLRRVCAAVRIPVIAIAGITEQRIASVLEAGAHGVAVMTAVSLADDPEKATHRLRARIDEVLGAD